MELEMHSNRRSPFKRVTHTICAAALAIGLTSCFTAKVKEGIQDSYVAINPSLVLAMPPRSVSQNGPFSNIHISYNAKVGSTTFARNLDKQIEGAVLKAFKGQPGVNGASFKSVRRTLKKTNTDEQLTQTLASAYKNFSDQYMLARGDLTWECRHANNFLAFYNFCLSEKSNWVSSLNKAAIHTKLADTALFPVILKWERIMEKKQNSYLFRIALILVDTNNAKLIWGKIGENHLSLKSVVNKSELKKGVEKIILAKDFWKDFPGYNEHSQGIKK